MPADAGKLSWPRVARSYGYTSVFCAAIAVTLWLMGATSPFWASVAVSFSIGYSINTTSLVLQPLLANVMSRTAAPLLTTIIGVGVGVMLGGAVALGDPWFFFSGDYSTVVLALFFGVLGFMFFTTREKLADAQAQLAQTRAAQLDQEKQHLETQLRLLQAQIEPHFLFNTLSNIAGMIHDAPADAERTLLNLTTLLRATLKRSRDGVTATLGDELDIVRALLEINQTRMGERLHYHIDVDDNLETLPLPPMLLQPLVENAIKHGIDPLEAGGEIRIRIWREPDELVIDVEDTGAGVSADSPAGTGIGIANVQARLGALYQQQAQLDLKDNAPTGMIASMRIPLPSP